jgi:hypothetical protein
MAYSPPSGGDYGQPVVSYLYRKTDKLQPRAYARGYLLPPLTRLKQSPRPRSGIVSEWFFIFDSVLINPVCDKLCVNSAAEDCEFNRCII